MFTKITELQIYWNLSSVFKQPRNSGRHKNPNGRFKYKVNPKWLTQKNWSTYGQNKTKLNLLEECLRSKLMQTFF